MSCSSDTSTIEAGRLFTVDLLDQHGLLLSRC